MNTSPWPQPASPNHPPEVNFYFARLIGDTPQEMRVVNFATKWQAGVYLRSFLEDGELLECEDVHRRSNIRYLVVTERDAQGLPMKGKKFMASIVGATYAEVMEASKDRTDVQLPWEVDNWRRMARGEKSRGYQAWCAGREDLEPKVEGAPRERVARAAGTPRASREGLITLANLCKEEGVEASDVRAALRKKKVEKPAAGWAFAEGDELLGVVMDTIAMVKRGG